MDADGPGRPADDVGVPATVPPTRTFVLAYTAVVVGGLMGALAGYGVVSAACHGDCAVPIALGTLVGAVVAAAGVGLVAVLVLQNMHLWRVPRDDAGPEPK